MKICILGGAGLIGAGIVLDLLSDRAIIDISTLRVCDLSIQRLEALAAQCPDPRLELVTVDLSNEATIREALAGMDLCLNAVPTLAGHQMLIFELALELRIPYLDLGGLGTFTVAQKAMHDRFVEAGVMAVIGTGADPGMSNVICRMVADRLDTIEKINLYWAAESVGPESPILTPPYSLSTVLAEYANPSIQFLDGKHVEVPPMSGVEYVDLPEPWGRAEFMHSPHSEQLTVPLADGIREKGIKEFTWKLHLPHRAHEAWVGLVKAGFEPNPEPVIIDGVAVDPTRVLDAVINRNLARKAEECLPQESYEIHFAIGVGTVGGLKRKVRCDVVVKPDPLYAPYIDAATSMNGSIAAQLMLLQANAPGVWAPEEFFATEPYIAELAKRRFEVSVTTYDENDAPVGTENLTPRKQEEPVTA